MQVFILESHGDEYHGSHIVGCYTTKELAESKQQSKEADQERNPSCIMCDFEPCYIISELPLTTESGSDTIQFADDQPHNCYGMGN